MADGPWEIVQRINRAWRAGGADALGELFHEQAVIVQPISGERTEGRQACVESYLEFTAQATVHRFDEHDPQVDVAGDSAVVTYGFQISYGIGGQTFSDRGRDVLVLVRGGAAEAWQVIWRTLVTGA